MIISIVKSGLFSDKDHLQTLIVGTICWVDYLCLRRIIGFRVGKLTDRWRHTHIRQTAAKKCSVFIENVSSGIWTGLSHISPFPVVVVSHGTQIREGWTKFIINVIHPDLHIGYVVRICEIPLMKY